MAELLNWGEPRLLQTPKILQQQGLVRRGSLLATVHRSENTDNLSRLAQILRAFNSLDEPVIFPVHPRTQKAITETGFTVKSHVRLIDPVGYMDRMALARAARMVLTDCGGSRT